MYTMGETGRAAIIVLLLYFAPLHSYVLNSTTTYNVMVHNTSGTNYTFFNHFVNESWTCQKCKPAACFVRHCEQDGGRAICAECPKGCLQPGSSVVSYCSKKYFGKINRPFARNCNCKETPAKKWREKKLNINRMNTFLERTVKIHCFPNYYYTDGANFLEFDIPCIWTPLTGTHVRQKRNSCGPCQTGEYSLSPCWTKTSVCKNCTQCNKHQYAIQNCSFYNDTVCQECSICKGDKTMIRECTKYSDTLCYPKSIRWQPSLMLSLIFIIIAFLGVTVFCTYFIIYIRGMKRNDQERRQEKPYRLGQGSRLAQPPFSKDNYMDNMTHSKVKSSIETGYALGNTALPKVRNVHSAKYFEKDSPSSKLKCMQRQGKRPTDKSIHCVKARISERYESTGMLRKGARLAQPLYSDDEYMDNLLHRKQVESSIGTEYALENTSVPKVGNVNSAKNNEKESPSSKLKCMQRQGKRPTDKSIHCVKAMISERYESTDATTFLNNDSEQQLKSELMVKRKPLNLEGEGETPTFQSGPKKVSYQGLGLAPPRSSHDEKKEDLSKRKKFKSYNENDSPNCKSNCLQPEGILHLKESTFPVKAIYSNELEENTEIGRLDWYTSDSRHWNRFMEDSMDIKEIWVQYYELLELCKIQIDSKMQSNECRLLDSFSEGTGKINFAFYNCEISGVIKNALLFHPFRPAGNITHQEISNSVEPFITVCYKKDIPAVSTVFKQQRSTKYCLLVIDKYGNDIDSGLSVLSETCNRNCILERCDTSDENITAAIEKLLTRWVYKFLSVKAAALVFLSSDGQKDEKKLEQMSLLQVKENTKVCDQSRNDAQPFLNNESVRQFLSELIEESRALYDRADLPEDDKPRFPPPPKKISYQALEDLKKIKGVLAYGERFGTLNIFLETNLKPEVETEKDIRHVMQKMGINKVIFRYGSPFTKPYFQPGDKVFEHNFGSLAGFATESEAGAQGRHVYALLSKHVVQGRRAKTLFINGEDVGKILPIDEYELDIAAAQIHKSNEKFCSFMFSTEDRVTKTSQLYDFNNTSKSLSGKRVHLYGAVSSPGMGKVSIENLCVINENYVGVLFEDRKSVQKNFCVPGDSGAMVLTYCCDDDVLEVLGMIIGEQMQTRMKRYVFPVNPEEQAECCLVSPKSHCYIGFKIEDGLKALEERHRISYSLCFNHELEEDSGISSCSYSAPSTANSSTVSTLEKPGNSAFRQF